MRKLLLSIAMAIAFAISLSAQETTTIVVGDTTSTSTATLPAYFYYDGSYCQIIYLAEELQPGLITSISYYYQGSGITDNVSLYMAEVDDENFPSSSYWIPGSEFTQVFQGNVTYSGGWVTITLDEPFVYTATNNLAVTYIGARSWESGHSFRQTSRSFYGAHISYSDSFDYGIDVTPGEYVTGNTYQYVPNTKFEMASLDGDICLGAGGISVSNITSNSADITWTCYNEDALFSVSYKAETSEEWIVATPSEEVGTYTLGGLDPFTKYNVKLSPLCAEDESKDRIVTFTTYPADDNFVQAPFGWNFDDLENVSEWNFVNGSNAWVIGNAVNRTVDENGEFTSGNALYISSDNGSTNSYYSDTTSSSYAYTLVSFPEGPTHYAISFDWRCAGENNYDYAAVALLPPTTEFSTSMELNNGMIIEELSGSSEWGRVELLIPDTCIGNGYALALYWQNDDWNNYDPPIAIDNINLFATDCETIDSIQVECVLDDPSSATATIEVFDQNENADYLVSYRVSGDTVWQSVSGPSPITLSELQASSLYEIKVNAVCDGSDQAVASEIYTFITPCGEIATFPYIQSFESFVVADGAIGNSQAPVCWYNINGGTTGHYFYRTSGYSVSGDYSLGYAGQYSSSATGSESDWVISPMFALTGSERLNFSLRNYYEGYISPVIDVYACDVSQEDITSVADTSRFTLIRTITNDADVSQFDLFEVALTEYSGLTRIALAVRRASQPFYIDNFTVSAMPDCPQVQGVTAGPVTSTSAAVNFIVNSTDNAGWTIAWGTAESAESFDPETAATVTVNIGDEMPVMFDNLTTGETYYFAVKQNCDGGEFSEVVSANIPMITSVPYTQNFDDSDNVGEIEFLSSGTNTWAIGTAANNTMEDGVLTEGGALYISTDNGQTASYSISETSNSYACLTLGFGEANGFELSFDWKSEGEIGWDYMKVYLVPATESNLTNAAYQIGSEFSYDNNWNNFNTILQGSHSNGIYKLVFYWKNDNMYGSSNGAIVDNISIVPVACTPVSNVTAALVPNEDTEALPNVSVNVEDDNIGATYTLRYRTLGASDWTIVSDLSIDDFPYTVVDLEFSSVYEFQVSNTCEGGDEMPFVSAGNTVATPCHAITAPWEEDCNANPFEGVCWERYSGALPATGSVQTSALTPTEGGWLYSTTPVGGNSTGKIKVDVYYQYHYWTVTPSIRLEEGTTYQIAMDIQRSYYYDEASVDPTPADDDVFAVLYSTDNGATWSRSQGVIYADGDEDTEHNYSDLGPTATRCIYKLVDENDNPITGDVKFAFYGGSTLDNADNNVWVDNIAVQEWSDCQPPYGVAVNPLATEATVTFSTVSETNGLEYVVVEGEDADITSATPVTLDEFATSIELTGLAPATYYTVAVRLVCDGSETSEWSSAVTFRTLAEAGTIPYTCDFEDPNEFFSIVGTGANVWAIGSATFAGEEETGHSAYVSTDGGATYSAILDYNYTITYLYRDIDFGDDETAVYNLDFDCKGAGWLVDGNYYGGLFVYLLDPTPLPTNDAPNADILTGFTGISSWEHQTVELGNVQGVKRLVFMSYGYNSQAETLTPSAVDNISVTLSDCPSPQGVAVTNATTNSAQVSWIGQSDSYIISYRAEAETEVTTLDATASPFTLTDLQPATRYILGVQGICGEDTTQFSNIITFTTPCFDEAISAFPWTEGFEEGVDCWSQEIVSGNLYWNATDVISGVTGLTAAEGTKFAKINGTSRNSVTRLISPMLDLTSLGNPTLSFKHLQPVWPDDQDILSVYYRTSEEAEPVLLATYTDNITSWTEETFQLTDVSSTFQIIFEANIQYGYGIYVDDVTITGEGGTTPDPEPCDAPTNLAVSNITTTEATVTWVGTASAYEIKLNGGAVETVQTTTKTFANLTPATDYNVEVRAVCEGANSEWTTTTFSTLAEQGGEVVAPVATTINVTNLTHNSATLNGNITAGTETITSQGFMYQVVNAADWTTVEVSGTNISTTLNGLTPETTYRFKAFATTASGTAEGDILTFATTAAPVEIVAPTVTTLAATDVVANAATLNGTITAGNEAITSQGFMYRQAGAAEWTTVEAAGETIAATLTDLAAATTYNYKAFATTASGTTEGAEMSFTTLAGLADVANNSINAMIYPNPASDKATISVEGLNAEAQIVVSDAQGRILFNDTMSAGENTYELNTANYAAGVYYVRIISGNTISTQKLIVR